MVGLVYERRIGNIYNEDFYEYFYNFLKYIDNFNCLYNENINRLKYYKSVLFDLFSKVNNDILIDNKIKEIISSFYGHKTENKFFQDNFISLIIVLNTHKEIINLIPKKFFFSKTIEKKIDNIALFFYNNINLKNIKNINELNEEIERVKNLDFFKTLSTRQNFRNKYKNNDLVFKGK